MSCSEAQTQTIQAILASEGCGLADLAHTLRQKESDSQTERREKEEDWMCGEKKAEQRRTGWKWGVTKWQMEALTANTTMSLCGESNHSWAPDTAATTVALKSNCSLTMRFLTPTRLNVEARWGLKRQVDHSRSLSGTTFLCWKLYCSDGVYVWCNDQVVRLQLGWI